MTESLTGIGDYAEYTMTGPDGEVLLDSTATTDSEKRNDDESVDAEG